MADTDHATADTGHATVEAALVPFGMSTLEGHHTDIGDIRRTVEGH